jgi:hypothetical protein
MSSGVLSRAEDSMWQLLVLQITCGLIVVGSVATIGWLLLTSQIEKQGLDALFLLLVCLLFIVMFTPILVRAVPAEIRKKLAALVPRKGAKNDTGTDA